MSDPVTKGGTAPRNVSGMVMPEEQISASHTVQLADVPARQLDRLLSFVHELPITQGEAALFQSFVDSLATIVTGHAIAIVVGDGSERRSYRSEPEVRESLSPASREVETGKLFTRHLIERVVRIADSDAAIYVAGDDATLSDDSAPAVQLAHRALFLLESTRQKVRMHMEMERMRVSLQDHDSMLVQTDKLASLGQLAAGMVHEINNPLTSILAYTDFLSKRAAAREDPDDLERLRRITESAHRMLRLSRDIVAYARPSTSPTQPVVVSAVIEQALGFCEHLFEESGVTVERELGDGVLPVHGRPEQLAQVFVNLFTNACHAMPTQGGRLIVMTELVQDDTRVRIVVGDNGHGIAKENLEHVFVPFFTTKDQHHGTGLGLAIVKRIVEAHAGAVDVESDGHGTRFVIVLPVAPEG